MGSGLPSCDFSAKTRKKADLTPVLLAILQFQEHVIALPWPHEQPPDEDDVAFLEVALQVPEQTVVTDNLKHFPSGCRGPVSVLSPRAAWDRFVGLGLT